jgi:hypothetical protein
MGCSGLRIRIHLTRLNPDPIGIRIRNPWGDAAREMGGKEKVIGGLLERQGEYGHGDGGKIERRLAKRKMDNLWANGIMNKNTHKENVVVKHSIPLKIWFTKPVFQIRDILDGSGSEDLYL